MTAVDSGTSRSGLPAGETVSPAVPPGMTPPPRTTVPSRPAGRARQPRQLSLIRLRDVVSLIGSLAAALATTGLLWQEISPFSGILGYIVATWVLFVLYYTVVISFDEDQPAVRDRVSAVVVHSLGALVAIALGAVLFYTFVRAWPALRHLNFYTQDGKASGPTAPLTKGGAWHAIVGTLIELAISMGIAIPLGLLAAIFMAEVPGPYARFVRTVVDAMTAMPDVLAGLFIYATIIEIFGIRQCGLAAGLALGITAMPIICRAADVVLRLVPGGLTEASYALGAGQWRTVRFVMLPTARSGLATAVILGAARAIGETAPVLLTAGVTDFLNLNPVNGSMMSLPLMVWTDYQEPEAVEVARAFGAAFVLLVLVLVLFATARRIGGRGPGQLTAGQQRRRAVASRRDAARYTRYARAAQPGAAPGWAPTPGAATATRHATDARSSAAGSRVAQEWQ
jgi:phosphate transport system permease protein